MKVVTKLRAAFALYITLLAVLLIYHVSTIQRVVRTGHELAEISTRVRATSTEQVTRIAQLGETASKYWVTHDRGYLNKFRELYTAYDAELRHLRELPLGSRERREITALTATWDSLGDPTPRLAAFVRLNAPEATRDSLQQLQRALDAVQLGTQRVGEASQAVMATRVAHSASAATAAERLSWIAAVGTLLLSLGASALIARSIAEPLQRLTVGTRAVAQGQFEYRLDSSRDDEFADVARDFNTMTAKLGALDQMKKDFISQVSHDLKTPLTSMRETISALLDELPGPITDSQRRLLELNQQSGDRLASMLGKLLDVSRLEAGVAPELHVTDGPRLVRDAVDEMAVAHNERGIRVDVVLPDERLLLECDADRIRQVVDNLVENAMKFSPDGRAVDVTVDPLDDRPADVPRIRWALLSTQPAPLCVMRITVADRGVGVPDAQKERIFERFYQSDAGRTVPRRGVGLGLTICREIVAAHGGALWVADNPGGGSRFTVLLPRAFRAAADNAEQNPSAPAAHGAPFLPDRESQS